MGSHIVKDGNAYYEIDDECMKRKNPGLRSGKTVKAEPPRESGSPGNADVKKKNTGAAAGNPLSNGNFAPESACCRKR